MKKLLPLMLIACLALPSCGLLNLASSNQAVYQTPGGALVNPITAAISSIAPNPRNLTAQEDPGTGLYGYLNEYGVWVIAPTYRNASNFNTDIGLAIVQISNQRWGAIDVYAQTVIQFSFDSRFDVESAIRSILKGRYVGIDLWEMYDTNTELWGYLDYYGNWYIQPQYRHATSMSSDGFAIVQMADTGLWGAIDRRNNIIVQPNFKSRFDAESALKTLLSK
ncbi:MAG: WG repeat-containing protein [Bacteroidales bacterium]|nr:WG repeat-containing protein [Bacteroidales bacterium]